MVKEKEVVLFLAMLSSGGAQAVIITLANQFAERGYDVKLLVGTSNGPLKASISDKVKLIDFECRRLVTTIPKLVSYLKTHKPTSIISTQIHSNLTLILAVKLAGVNTKTILRECTTPSQAFKLSNNKKERFIYRVAQYFLKYGDKFIAVSKGVKEDMTMFYQIAASKIEMIYNPIIDKKMYEKAEEQVVHPWIDEDVKILSTLSRIAPSKDIESIINSFASVRKNKNIRLIIIGGFSEEDAYYKKLVQLIKDLNLQDDIYFTGFQINPFKWLKISDLFVFSSLLEGLPGSLVQALALNCKIVSSDCKSGPKEILLDGKFGSIFPVKNNEALTDAIIYELNNNPTKDQAKDIHLQQFMKNKVTDQYLQVIFNQVQ